MTPENRISWKVPLFETDFGPAERKAVQEPLESGWVTSGEITARFERMFAERVGAKHAIAVSNCTAALHLALAAAGIGPGDEVVCPSITFVATANAVCYVGATPVFCNPVSLRNLNVGADQIASRITERTRAVIVVHYAGFPVDMPAVMELAADKGLVVIEDCAHALFSRLRGRMCGTWGAAGAFSFFGNKNMTCGEGGMVTSEDDRVAERVRVMRSHGMTTLSFDRYLGRATGYDVVEHGYNYRSDEIRSALAIAQLGRLDGFLRERQRVRDAYCGRLAESAVSVPEFDWSDVSRPGDFVGHHIMPILLPAGLQRNLVIEAMKRDGIQTSVHYRPVHTFSVFEGKVAGRGGLALAEEIGERELTLPLYPGMTDSQIEMVCDSLGRAVAGARRTS